MAEEKLLSTQDVMTKLKVSRQTLYKLMERGKIAPVGEKPTYLNKRPKLQFRESDVEMLISGEGNATK